MNRPALLLASAIASTFAPAVVHAADPGFDADRKAILAMLGEYRVDFHFEETVALTPGYSTHPSDDTGGFEVVILVEDSGRRISLQHLLVGDGGHVTKHWRQDWVYEAPERFEFSADQTFSRMALSPEQTRGAWTQCVFEVSDAPRYCGTGRWDHHYGSPTWTSDRSWRPLPRREYTTRSDYNAVDAQNRHTITPTGWTHEQDNNKVVRKPEGSSILAREFGFNEYERIQNHDFKPAYEYWRKTSPYWARVRAVWAERLASGDALVLKTKLDGMPIIMATFQQAEDAAEGKPVSDADIAAVFDKYTQVLLGAKTASTR